MEKEDKYIEDTKKKIRSLLLSAPVGLTLKELVRDYNDFLGEPIPYSKCEYASLDEMLIEFTDVLRVDNNNGVMCLTAVADDSTKHIEKLVSKQKLTKPFKWQTIKSNRRSETAARYSPHSRKGISRKNKNWLEKSTRKKSVPNISFCTRRRSLTLNTKKQKLLPRTPHRTTRLASVSSTKGGLKSPLSSGRVVRTPEHNKADVSTEKRTSPNSHVPSSLRKNIILLMKTYPSGIPLEDFEAAFHLRFKTRLNISCLRFRSITELLSNMQDVVNLKRQGREMFVLPVKDTPKKRFQTSRKTPQKQIERFTEPKNSNETKNKIEESFSESGSESESKKKKPKTSDQTSARKSRRQSLKSLKKTNYKWSTPTEPSPRTKRLSSRGRKSYSGNDSLSLTPKRWKRDESRRLYSENIEQINNADVGNTIRTTNSFDKRQTPAEQRYYFRHERRSQFDRNMEQQEIQNETYWTNQIDYNSGHFQGMRSGNYNASGQLYGEPSHTGFPTRINEYVRRTTTVESVTQVRPYLPNSYIRDRVDHVNGPDRYMHGRMDGDNGPGRNICNRIDDVNKPDRYMRGRMDDVNRPERYMRGRMDGVNGPDRYMHGRMDDVNGPDRYMRGRMDDVNRPERYMRGRMDGVNGPDRYMRGRIDDVNGPDRYMRGRMDGVNGPDRYMRGRMDDVNGPDRYMRGRMDDVNGSDRYMHGRMYDVNGPDRYMHGRMDDVNGPDRYMHGRMDDVNGPDRYMHGRMDDVNGPDRYMRGRMDDVNGPDRYMRGRMDDVNGPDRPMHDRIDDVNGPDRHMRGRMYDVNRTVRHMSSRMDDVNGTARNRMDNINDDGWTVKPEYPPQIDHGGALREQKFYQLRIPSISGMSSAAPYDVTSSTDHQDIKECFAKTLAMLLLTYTHT